MNLSKVITAIALSVAFAATLAAAPQATPPPAPAPAPAKSTPAKTITKPAAPKAETVAAADLPKAVTDAIMKAHPNGKVASATKGLKGTNVTYAIKVTDAGKTVTMNLMADGTKVPVTPKAKQK